MESETSENAESDFGVGEILDLLARDAPPGDFESLLRRAGELPLGPARRNRLRHAVRTALDIRATTERQRRRESALAALVDTGRDIFRHKGLDERLDVVTRHARRLLGLDMAYVSLRIADGGSYVHNSDGDTTALNVGLEMDRGRGLGELAQDRSAPYWTADYLADDSFPHTEEIDRVVRSEGLHAVLAVPMSSGGRMVGALYGASRAVRHFTPDEVSLLRLLADLSAPAIEATRRMDGVRSELARALAENTRLDEELAAARRLADAQTTLSGMCLEGRSLHDIVRYAASALGGDLAVRDAAGRVLAGTGEPPRADAASMVRGIADSRAGAAAVRLADDLWAAHVTTGVEGPGLLICRTGEAFGDERRRLLHFTAQTVATVLLRHDLATAAGPIRDDYLDDLLSGTTGAPRHLAERAHRLGLDPAADHVMVVLRPEGKQGEAAIWASSYAYRHAGLKTVRRECLVLLLPGSDPSAAARSAVDELTALLGHAVSAGAAGPVHGFASADTAYAEAVRCLDTLIAIGGRGGVAAAGDLGFLGLLVSDDHDVEAFVASAIGSVLDYDRQRSTDLAGTLDAYFSNGGSPSRAALELHVHTNTVARRLERITDLLGADWQRPATALEIQLALRLQRAREAVRRP
ncbi:helix-turn-helix domain-containing protein [Streptomyces griseus]|uniref:helix-turn-helix domain-containing protein n=1 Tax=Streptomyces griseus TaxID=1911 RepID=UPI0037F863A8